MRADEAVTVGELRPHAAAAAAAVEEFTREGEGQETRGEGEGYKGMVLPAEVGAWLAAQ